MHEMMNCLTAEDSLAANVKARGGIAVVNLARVQTASPQRQISRPKDTVGHHLAKPLIIFHRRIAHLGCILEST